MVFCIFATSAGDVPKVYSSNLNSINSVLSTSVIILHVFEPERKITLRLIENKSIISEKEVRGVVGRQSPPTTPHFPLCFEMKFPKKKNARRLLCTKKY
jgi:hypothetical protein